MKELKPKEAMLVGIVILIFILGARWAWAELVYHDASCMFAECRIQISL